MRRGFLRVLGASAALAGAAACKPPREKVVAYVRQPPEVTPSRPDLYATATSMACYAVGLVVTSNAGRPTKVEGNRGHPASLGGSGRQEQATLLDLYDPARLEDVRHRGRGLGWSAFLVEVDRLAAGHARDGGARLRFLCEPGTSPAAADLRRAVLERFPRSRFDVWAPTGDDALREGLRIATGRDLLPRWTPIGMKFSTLAGTVGGGAQTPGFMGIGVNFIASRKFLFGDGGVKRIVWMPKALKERIAEDFMTTAEAAGAADLLDKIADESVCEDSEKLVEYLSQVGHPALSMDPMI